MLPDAGHEVPSRYSPNSTKTGTTSSRSPGSPPGGSHRPATTGARPGPDAARGADDGLGRRAEHAAGAAQQSGARAQGDLHLAGSDHDIGHPRPRNLHRRLNAVPTRTRCLRVEVGVVTPKPRAAVRVPHFTRGTPITLSRNTTPLCPAKRRPRKPVERPHVRSTRRTPAIRNQSTNRATRAFFLSQRGELIRQVSRQLFTGSPPYLPSYWSASSARSRAHPGQYIALYTNCPPMSACGQDDLM